MVGGVFEYVTHQKCLFHLVKASKGRSNLCFSVSGGCQGESLLMGACAYLCADHSYRVMCMCVIRDRLPKAPFSFGGGPEEHYRIVEVLTSRQGVSAQFV